MKLLDQAWISVSEKSIKTALLKSIFFNIKKKKTASKPKNELEGIWGRLQTAGLVPKDVGFNEYVEGDANLVMHETITILQQTKFLQMMKITTMKTVWMSLNLSLLWHLKNRRH